MIWFVCTILIAVGIWAALYGYKKWGASDEKRKQARRNARDLEKDAEIAADPNVSNPLDRM